MSGGQIDLLGAPDVGGERHKHDAYDTPEWATRCLVDYLGDRGRCVLTGRVWEPCAGAGAIAGVLERHAPCTVFRSDIDPRGEGIATLDFLSTDDPPYSVDWIVTNPPYTTGRCTATDIVRHALSICDRVAMLLRIGWAEACRDRTDIFGGAIDGLEEIDRGLTDLVILPRVSFIGAPAANNQTSCWFVWDEVDSPPWGTVRMRRYPADVREPGYWTRGK